MRGFGRTPERERVETDSEAETGYERAWVGNQAPSAAAAGAGVGAGEYASAAPAGAYPTRVLPQMGSHGESIQTLQGEYHSDFHNRPQDEPQGESEIEPQSEAESEPQGEFQVQSGSAPLSTRQSAPEQWEWEPLTRDPEGGEPREAAPAQNELEPQGEGYWDQDGQSQDEAQDWMQGLAGAPAGAPLLGVESGGYPLAAEGVPAGDEALHQQGRGQDQEGKEEQMQAEVLEQSPQHRQGQERAMEGYLEQGQDGEQVGLAIQRTETVPGSFLWGESGVVPQDWLEWPPQRTPRSISNILPGFTELPTGFDEALDGDKGLLPDSLEGFPPLGVAMGVPQAERGRVHAPAAGPGGAGDQGKQPTFVRRFSSARRARGVRSSAGPRGTLRPVLNKVGAPAGSSPLRPTLSEGVSSQAGSEPDALSAHLGEGPSGGRRRQGGARERAPGEGLAGGVPGWHSPGIPGVWLPLTVRSAPQTPVEAARPFSGQERRMPLSWREEEEGKRSSSGRRVQGDQEPAPAEVSPGAEAPAWVAGPAQPEGNLLGSKEEEGTMVRHEEDRRRSRKPGASRALNLNLSPPQGEEELSPRQGEAALSPRQAEAELSPDHSPLGQPQKAKQQLSPLQAPGPPPGPLWVYPFSWEQLFLATNGLAAALRISRKPAFSVYRGRLQDGREVTVKVPSQQGDAAAEARLWAEARALASVRHRNLIELLGVCHAEGGAGGGPGSALGAKVEAPRAQAVVYEYIDGTALNEALAAGSDFALPWAQRHRVALDVAQAIMYLHTGLPELTPHGNVTSSNVMLLKDSLAAKLGGFNAARGSRETGPPGAQSMAAVEDDIIAFGFLLLELICGQRRHGIREVLPVLRAGRAEEIACPSVRAGCTGHVQFHQLIATVLTCLDNQQPNSISTINVVMMALTSEPLPWLRPSGAPMRLSQSIDSPHPMPFGPAQAQHPPAAAAPLLGHPRSLHWEHSDGYESAPSDTERGGASGLQPARAYPGMPGGAIGVGASRGLGMPSVPEDPQLLAWSQQRSVHYQQHQQQQPQEYQPQGQYQHHQHFQQQQQMLQAQQGARLFPQHLLVPQLEPLDGYWSHGTGGHGEGTRNPSVTESSALAETLSFHSIVQGTPSEAGESQSQSYSQSQSHSQRTQSVASMSLHMRKLEQLQQQQQQLLMLLLQQQRLSPAVASQLYSGHISGLPPLSALPQMGGLAQAQHKVPLAPEVGSRAGGAFWGAFGAHSVAPGAYPVEEHQMPMGHAPAGLQHQQDMWRGGLNGSTSRQQSRTAAGFQPGGFHGGPAADALARAGLGVSLQQQGQLGQEGTQSNPGSWVAMDQIQERKQQNMEQGQEGMQEDEQDDNGTISTCSVHCSSEGEGTST